jgi:hypothetical protein
MKSPDDAVRQASQNSPHSPTTSAPSTPSCGATSSALSSQDRLWHRIDSWDRIDATIQVNRHTLRLSDFQWARDPEATECRAQLQPKKRNINAYKALSSQGLLEQAARSAVQKRNQLAKQGHITAWLPQLL